MVQENLLIYKKNTMASIGDFVNAIQVRNIYIEDAAGNRNYSFDIDLRNFVIHHLSDERMGVRILLPNPAILADTPLQLDLNIQILDVLQGALGKANTKTEVFLMDKRNLMLKEAITVFRRTLLPPYHEFKLS